MSNPLIALLVVCGFVGMLLAYIAAYRRSIRNPWADHYDRMDRVSKDSWVKLYMTYGQIVELINIIWTLHSNPPKGYPMMEKSKTHERLYQLLCDTALSLEAKERTQ